ncbi:hypothetical protein PIROE2DRAFT_7193 [Piromyces sp. E2]|nr:hypothetical protein PIROE2DRAFT_7193 [Piromyces sp. E2]|eukprot:OUM65776.1 hypothetical protein PIROE2DRAFT_7193 [Piromyces sp. E2]
MDFNEFETEFLKALKKNKKDCLRIIEVNQKIIEVSIGEEGNQKTIEKFVNAIIDILFEAKKYSLFEKSLKHPFFFKVYQTFKNSEVLIEACKRRKKDLLKWLITMDINPCIQDENGMTALMHATKFSQQLFVIKYLLTKPECLNLVDKNGENAVFHALNNLDILKEIVHSDIDINSRNNNNESAFLYCCKNDIFNPIPVLIENKKLDVNIVDKAEKTPAMILAEKGRYNEIKSIRNNTIGYDFNFRNSQNESVLSCLINKMYLSGSTLFVEYIRVIAALVFSNCDFNIPVDEVGNTAFMVFMIVQDWYTVYYIARNGKNINLSVKNNFGESATSLFLKYGSYNRSIFEVFTNNKTFDFEYIDPNSNNNLLMLSAMKEPKLINTIIENNVNSINCINYRNENALILATKFNNEDAVGSLLKFGVYINQQDYLGNTALYYAVDNKNYKIIRLLLKNNADKNLNNSMNISPLNHAHNLGDKKLIEALTNPDFDQQFGLTTPCDNNDQMSNGNFDPLEKFHDTAEYLYPCISNNYPKFNMTYQIECLEKSIYMGNMRNIEMSGDYIPPYQPKFY